MNDDFEKYPLFQKITAHTNMFPVMSETVDQIVEAAIFRFFQPKNIIELGAATGNWCALYHSLCKDLVDQHYTLVEDFSWCATDDVNYRYSTEFDFPNNKTQLENHLSDTIDSFTVIDSTVDALIDTDMHEKFDLIRIDCDPVDDDNWNTLISWIDRNGSDRLIILSDDIKPTVAPQRMLVMQQLVAQGKMNIMWIGEDTAAWCRPDMLHDIRRWYNSFKITQDSKLLDIDCCELMLYGYPQWYLSTKRNHIYQEQHKWK
jgi:hypothetical protein